MANKINIRSSDGLSWINLLEAINIYVENNNNYYLDNNLENILQEIYEKKSGRVIYNVDPQPSNDSFDTGTIWTNTNNKHSFICVNNATLNAEWALITTVGSETDIQNTVGNMVINNVEKGIYVTYDSLNRKLDFDVRDPLLTIAGDVTGSAIMQDLGNTTITVIGDFYKKIESDNRYVNTTGDSMDGGLNINGNLTLFNGTGINEISTNIFLSESSDSILSTQKAIKAYIDNVTGGIDSDSLYWQDPVNSKSYNSPPFPSGSPSGSPSASPSGSNRYIVNSPGQDEWLNHDNEITKWDGTQWIFIPLVDGQTVFVEDESRYYIYNNDWINILQDINIDVVDVNNHFTSTFLDGVLEELYYYSIDDIDGGTY